MRPHLRRVAAGLAVVATLLGAASGCAALPTMPTPLPAGYGMPSPAAAVSAAPISADGFAAAQRMAVRVRNVGCGSMSTGSGFALDSHTLVTNQHVTEDSAALQLSTYDGHDIDVENATMATLADLAVVRTVEELPAASDLSDADPQVGDQVTIAGYPLGGPLTVTTGTVRAKIPDPLHKSAGDVYLVDASINYGSSGSGVLGADGSIVGVVYAMNSEHQALIIPVSTLRDLLSSSEGFTPAPSCSAR